MVKEIERLTDRYPSIRMGAGETAGGQSPAWGEIRKATIFKNSLRVRVG